MSIDTRAQSVAVQPPQIVQPPTPAPRPIRGRSRWSGWNTPNRIRAFAAGIMVATLGFLVVGQLAVAHVRGGWQEIGHHAAPQVVSTTNLSLALGDMDAQLANILLVADRPDLGLTRRQSLDIYDNDRRTVNASLQQAAVLAGTNPTAVGQVQAVLDGLGRYEALAAQAILLETQAAKPVPGRPPVAALDMFRQAGDLMRTTVQPAANALTQANSAALDQTYERQKSGTRDALLAVIVLGLLILAGLIGLQVFLTVRTHRILNPALVLATVVAAAVSIAGLSMLVHETRQLDIAKKDAFDSLLVLTRARAVSSDANADESRYLVDPGRAGQYEQAFLDKSQQVVDLEGATIHTFGGLLDDAVKAYATDHADVRFTGFYGTEFRNITFAGEREAAEATIAAYQVYQHDDRHIRELNTAGNLQEAIRFCTSFAPGDSNAAYTAYDKALVKLTDINQQAFNGAVAAGEHGLRGWSLIPWIACALIAALVLLGVRPRLSEYR